MFIAGDMHQISQSPRGATCEPGGTKIGRWATEAVWIRRGWVPQPAGRGDLSPTMDTAQPIVPHLAPEGRHVYSIRDIHQLYALQRSAGGIHGP